MKLKKVISRARSFADPFCITDGHRFRLKDVDPKDTLHLSSEDKPRAKEALAIGVEALAALQDVLYANDRWAVLLIFQALDAAGKEPFKVSKFSRPCLYWSLMFSKPYSQSECAQC